MLLAVMTTSNPILAEELSPADKETSVQLGQSIISPDYIEIEKLKSTKQVIVLEKEDIQDKGYTSLSKALNDVPGITVGVTGWGDIDIRGQGEGESRRNLQVLVDGAPITMLVNHPYSANYDIIPVDQIEKIEVIPGGGSVLYGGGTSGGVINITTNLKSMNEPKNRVGFEYGKDSEKKYNVNLGTKVGDDLVLQLNYANSDRDWYFVDTYSKTKYLSGGLNYRINDNQALSLKYSRFTEDGQFIKTLTQDSPSSENDFEGLGRNYRPSPKTITIGLDENGVKVKKRVDGYLLADREEDYLKASYTAQFSKNTLFLLDLFHNKGTFKNNWYEGVDDMSIDQKTSGGKAKFDVKYGKKSSLLFGIDYYKQDANLAYNDYQSKNTKDGFKADTAAGETVTSWGAIKNANGDYLYVADPLVFDYDKQTKAAYVMNILKFNDIEFSTGARFDRTEWKTYKDQAGGWGVIDDESIRNNMNYSTSLGWMYRDTGKIYARYEQTFASPDGKEITDRVYDGDEKVTKLTNADDQITDLYEIGLREYILGSAINLTGFFSTTDNQLHRIIQKNSAGKYEYKTVNIYDTDRYGVELTARQEFGPLSLQQGYTYLMGKSKINAEGKALGREYKSANGGLKKVPRNNIVLKADLEITDNFSVGAAWKYTGNYNNVSSEDDRYETNYDGTFKLDENGNKIELAGNLVKSHSLTDISFRYDHPCGVAIFGGINNLFDKEYFGYQSGTGNYISVIPEPGRVYYVGMNYTF